jgi:hypothetical protein
MPSKIARPWKDLAPGDTVHVLKNGRPLCRFTAVLFPANWPGGHFWVGMEDAYAANCAKCQARCAEPLQ